jgi:hypothetical protein
MSATNQTKIGGAGPEFAGWSGVMLDPVRGRDGALRRPRRRAQRQATESGNRDTYFGPRSPRPEGFPDQKPLRAFVDSTFTRCYRLRSLIVAMDYKDTLNLPRTDFAMKADLVTREPERLKKWEAASLYARIQAARASAEKFVLHDGPPFANGDVHIGTALNKILKDIIIKYQTLRGKSAPYIPGWDCHGLPIEFKVSQELRKAGDTNADAATIRKACEAYARKYIDLQRVQFKRLGVLGDWENPYLTLNKEYEADELRLFADIVAKGFVYRGKKPV